MDDREASRQHVQQIVLGLTSEERMLVVLKRELYDGRWEDMAADLEGRLHGRPFVFKLAHRIEDDLDRIERLRALEADNGVDLADFVTMDNTPRAGE